MQVLALFLFLCLPLRAESGDWPQWRGADGMAVSQDAPLPSRIDASGGELLWKVPVEGQGISSPIVSAGRVFVTTAYRAEAGAQVRSLLGLIFGAAVLASLLALGGLTRSRRDVESGGGTLASRVRSLDRIATLLGTLGGVALALVTSFQPERLGRPDSPGHTWLIAGAIGLACAAVAVGWFRARSPMRWIGAIVLLVLAVPLFLNIPLNNYGSPFRLRVRAVMVAPALAGAAWHLLVFLLSRRSTGGRGVVLSAVGASTLFAVAGAMFLLQTAVRPSIGLTRAVVCFDLESGRELWSTALFVAPAEKKYAVNSWATPTACADGEVVFAHFGSGYACLDYEGEVLWGERELGFEELTRYGASTSPIFFEDTVLVLHDKELDLGPSYVMALDKATGDVRWRVEPQENHDSYMTPLLMRRAAGFELITVSSGEVVSYDPRTGDELWSVPVPIEQMVPSVQHRGDLLLVSGGLAAKASTEAIRLTGAGKDMTTERVWSSRRGAPSISTPVLVGDLFFTASDAGVLTCWDAETGATHWRERLEGPFYSSLVAGDGKVYALNDHGRSYVLAAAPEFELVSEGELDEPCYATPAIAGERVIVRTAGHLWAFGR